MSRSIFIFSNRNNPANGYRQITEAELQRYKKSSESHIINLGYALMDVTKADYKDFYKIRRRQKYIREETARAGEFSYNALDTDEFDGASFISDDSKDVEDRVLRKIMIENFPQTIATFSEDEKQFIGRIYFEHISETKLAEEYGITRHKTRILKKLKKYFEK